MIDFPARKTWASGFNLLLLLFVINHYSIALFLRNVLYHHHHDYSCLNNPSVTSTSNAHHALRFSLALYCIEWYINIYLFQILIRIKIVIKFRWILNIILMFIARYIYVTSQRHKFRSFVKVVFLNKLNASKFVKKKSKQHNVFKQI